MAVEPGALENMVMNKNFWSGKRVLLTGHTGFKGSWLALWLQQLGAKVTGFALNPVTAPNLFVVADVASRMQSVMGDIRDADLLLHTLQKAQPEIVIHMAAQALVRYSYAHPAETYATNVMGWVNLLEAIKSTPGVRVVVNVTSDKCYENKEWLWGYREIDPLGGYDPYSNSKACAELITSAYRSSFFNSANYEEHKVALASVRAGNVIGGGDWSPDRLIPDILCALQENRPVKIRNPNAIRPWQHVLEPLYGYLLLIEKLYTQGVEFAEAWNFGANDEDAKPVKWIVDKLTQAWGEKASWELDPALQLHEAQHLKLDCSKAKAKLDWQPRWNLEETLINIMYWHKNYLQNKDMRAFTLQQITSYSLNEGKI